MLINHFRHYCFCITQEIIPVFVYYRVDNIYQLSSKIYWIELIQLLCFIATRQIWEAALGIKWNSLSGFSLSLAFFLSRSRRCNPTKWSPKIWTAIKLKILPIAKTTYVVQPVSRYIFLVVCNSSNPIDSYDTLRPCSFMTTLKWPTEVNKLFEI